MTEGARVSIPNVGDYLVIPSNEWTEVMVIHAVRAHKFWENMSKWISDVQDAEADQCLGDGAFFTRLNVLVGQFRAFQDAYYDVLREQCP
jgi:hypothetical protein